MFLNKVRGSVSIPYFRRFVSRYPTPQSLLENSTIEEVTDFMRPLGLQTHRARNVWSLAKSWAADDPYAKPKGESSWRRKSVYKPEVGVPPKAVFELRIGRLSLETRVIRYGI